MINSNSARVRALVTALVVAALSLAGFSPATPASAAVTTLSGTGPGNAQVTLSAGFYQAELWYENNRHEGADAVFGALLDSDNQQVLEYFAIDRKPEGSTIKVVQLFERTTLSFEVPEAAPDATWKLTFEKLSVPTVPQSSLSIKNTGLSSSPLAVLKAGNYQVTTTFENNTYDEGLEDFQSAGIIIDLYSATGDDTELLHSTDVAGRVTKTVKLAHTGLYWVNPIIVPTSALWSVQLVALKNLTAVTPKISGTTKVGKTLKATAGTWKPSGVQLTYQWYRGSSKIAGATKSSYKLTSADKGKKVTVKVRGSKSGYLSVTKTSKATAAIKK